VVKVLALGREANPTAHLFLWHDETLFLFDEKEAPLIEWLATSDGTYYLRIENQERSGPDTEYIVYLSDP
jgi:hypothetical protein